MIKNKKLVVAIAVTSVLIQPIQAMAYSQTDVANYAKSFVSYDNIYDSEKYEVVAKDVAIEFSKLADVLSEPAENFVSFKNGKPEGDVRVIWGQYPIRTSQDEFWAKGDIVVLYPDGSHKDVPITINLTDNIYPIANASEDIYLFANQDVAEFELQLDASDNLGISKVSLVNAGGDIGAKYLGISIDNEGKITGRTKDTGFGLYSVKTEVVDIAGNKSQSEFFKTYLFDANNGTLIISNNQKLTKEAIVNGIQFNFGKEESAIRPNLAFEVGEFEVNTPYQQVKVKIKTPSNTYKDVVVDVYNNTDAAKNKAVVNSIRVPFSSLVSRLSQPVESFVAFENGQADSGTTIKWGEVPTRNNATDSFAKGSIVVTYNDGSSVELPLVIELIDDILPEAKSSDPIYFFADQDVDDFDLKVNVSDNVGISKVSLVNAGGDIGDKYLGISIDSEGKITGHTKDAGYGLYSVKTEVVDTSGNSAQSDFFKTYLFKAENGTFITNKLLPTKEDVINAIKFDFGKEESVIKPKLTFEVEKIKASLEEQTIKVRITTPSGTYKDVEVVAIPSNDLAKMSESQIYTDATESYWHETHAKSDKFTDWMLTIDDNVKLNELSLPGTHDTMAYLDSNFFTLYTNTQSMPLEEQLKSGIRYLDIRLAADNNKFTIYHGDVYLGFDFDDVLRTVEKFLQEHPYESIVMRVKQEHTSVDDFEMKRRFDDYYNKYNNLFWNKNSNNPTLGEIRGKVVILADVASIDQGLRYSWFDIQDDYQVNTIWDLYPKWEKVKEHLDYSNNSGSPYIAVNHLSGSGFGGLPTFVASGKVGTGTYNAQKLTGLAEPFFNGYYPDFPRVSQVGIFSSIAFQGTNELTASYINKNQLSYVGFVVADFPGERLVSEVINANYRNIK